MFNVKFFTMIGRVAAAAATATGVATVTYKISDKITDASGAFISELFSRKNVKKAGHKGKEELAA
jgi:hypothetical protein